jgi:hypothetical protein
MQTVRRVMMMTLTALTSPLLACGDAGSSTSETTATAPSTGEPGTSTSATTGTNTDSTGVTSGDTSGVTTGMTGGPTTGMTTGMTTGESTGETASTTAVTTTTGGSESGTTAGETTGGGEVSPCVTDQDCTLVENCCDCESLNPGETAPECGMRECRQTECSAIGLVKPAVECRLGRCMFKKDTCNPFGVSCDAPQPQCGPGSLPSVEETNQGKCWTGSCVPAEVCDWVPDCSYCDDPELVCVGKLQKGAYKVCEAKPFECSDEDNLDCTCGQQVCDASPPHTVCSDSPDGINCECPFC